MTWQDSAACATADPALFFVESPGDTTAQVDAAKAVCAGCPVKAECLTYALQTHSDFGIWGGLTPHQRDRLRKEQGRPVKRRGEYIAGHPGPGKELTPCGTPGATTRHRKREEYCAVCWAADAARSAVRMRERRAAG